jgi:hypothetical protein
MTSATESTSPILGLVGAGAGVSPFVRSARAVSFEPARRRIVSAGMIAGSDPLVDIARPGGVVQVLIDARA